MKKTMVLKLLFLLVLFLYSVNSFPDSKTKNAWQLMAEQDIQFVHDTVLNQSSLPLGPKDDPGLQWIENGLVKASELSAKANSYTSYEKAIQFYVTGFQTPHIDLSLNLKLRSPNYKWPGFLLGLRNNNFEVLYTTGEGNKSSPEMGAKLLACNGLTGEQLYQKYISPYYTYAADKATWVNMVPWLLIDDDDTLSKELKQCDFETTHGKQSVTLNWTKLSTTVSSQLHELTEKAGYGPRPSVGIRAFSHNSIWISLPSFSPEGKDKLETQKVISKIKEFRNKDIIVIDVRVNGGGNLNYALDVIDNLYGEEYIKSLGEEYILNKRKVVRWRVTSENVDFVKSQKLQDAFLIKQLDAALKKGNNTYDEIQHEVIALSSADANNSKSPVSAKVFLLTDGRCYSSCWLFTRAMKGIEGVTQVGMPTGLMMEYTEARMVTSPSQAFELMIPMKLFIEPRDHFGKSFEPEFVYPGYMGDTEALQRWIETLARNSTAI